MRPELRESLMSLLDRVFFPGSGLSMAERFAFYLRPENYETLLIFRDGQRVVTHVGFGEWTVSCFGHSLRVGLVGGVATEPDYRGRGLATKAFQEAVRLHRERGGHLMMISGGRGMYLRNGACRVGEFPAYVVEHRAGSDIDSAGLGIERCRIEDAGVLGEMYRQKAIHFVRPLDEWVASLERGVCAGRPGEFWLIRRDGRPSAYLILSTGLGEKQDEWVVKEWGGSVRDALGALCELREREGLPKVHWTTYPHERELAAALERAGACRTGSTTMGGMLRVTNFVALMETLRGYSAERLDWKDAAALEFEELPGERFSIRVGDESLTIDGYGPLAEALFGPAPPAAVSGARGRLRHLLERLLPFPAVRYDLTYA